MITARAQAPAEKLYDAKLAAGPAAPAIHPLTSARATRGTPRRPKDRARVPPLDGSSSRPRFPRPAPRSPCTSPRPGCAPLTRLSAPSRVHPGLPAPADPGRREPRRCSYWTTRPCGSEALGCLRRRKMRSTFAALLHAETWDHAASTPCCPRRCARAAPTAYFGENTMQRSYAGRGRRGGGLSVRAPARPRAAAILDLRAD